MSVLKKGVLRFFAVAITLVFVIAVMRAIRRGDKQNTTASITYIPGRNQIEISIHINNLNLERNEIECIVRGEDVVDLSEEHIADAVNVYVFDIGQNGRAEIIICSDNINAENEKYTYDIILETEILVADKLIVVGDSDIYHRY